MIYDTGSDWLVLDTDNCYNCIQPVFNTANSTTFYMSTNQSMSNLAYGSANVYGYNVTDSAYITLKASNTSGTGLN